jgi:hypothetical protein
VSAEVDAAERRIELAARITEALGGDRWSFTFVDPDDPEVFVIQVYRPGQPDLRVEVGPARQPIGPSEAVQAALRTAAARRRAGR